MNNDGRDEYMMMVVVVIIMMAMMEMLVSYHHINYNLFPYDDHQYLISSSS